MNPGDFFQPLSAIMVLGVVGALISGWRSSSALRFWLWFAVIAFGAIWAITPTVFWPMINQLYQRRPGDERERVIQIEALTEFVQ